MNFQKISRKCFRILSIEALQPLCQHIPAVKITFSIIKRCSCLMITSGRRSFKFSRMLVIKEIH